MSQSALLPTRTIIQYNDDGTVQIITSYLGEGQDNDSLPNTIYAIITNQSGQLGSVSYIEGDLLIAVKNYPTQIAYTIDSNGDLILFDTTDDGTLYFVEDSAGDLMYGLIGNNRFNFILPLSLG